MSGIPVIAVPEWDNIIQKYEDTGTKWNNPHRAVSTKAVLGVGTDNASAFDNFSAWYNKDTREVKIEAMGQSDTVLTNPALFEVAI